MPSFNHADRRLSDPACAKHIRLGRLLLRTTDSVVFNALRPRAASRAGASWDICAQYWGLLGSGGEPRGLWRSGAVQRPISASHVGAGRLTGSRACEMVGGWASGAATMSRASYSDAGDSASGRSARGQGPVGRSWIGVRFTCAPAYVRAFIDRSGQSYVALCPRCGKSMRFRVGAEGTSRRMFDVSC